MAVERIGALKKKLWAVFALWRKYDNSKDGVYTHCISCSATLKIGTSNCQAGHYYPKRGYSGLYFDENNVYPQCYRCNINLGGNTQPYREELLRRIGEEGVADLDNRRHSLNKLSRSEYKELIAHYKQKVKDYENAKRIR